MFAISYHLFFDFDLFMYFINSLIQRPNMTVMGHSLNLTKYSLLPLTPPCRCFLELSVQLKRATFSNAVALLSGQGHRKSCTPLLEPPNQLSSKEGEPQTWLNSGMGKGWLLVPAKVYTLLTQLPLLFPGPIQSHLLLSLLFP